MSANKMVLRRLIVSIVLCVMLIAATAVTALAEETTGGTVENFEKVDSSDSPEDGGGPNPTVDVSDPIDFAVIKQATAAVVWTKYALTTDQQSNLTSIISTSGYDASLAHLQDGLHYTDLMDFTFNQILGTNDSQYATRVTVNEDKTELTITGAYSHYDVGNYVPEGGDPTPTPDPSNTPDPSATPTPDPSATPTPDPSATPTPDPSATPTPDPSATPTPDPSATPTPDPSATPTPDPSATPTPDPSNTPEPTNTPRPRTTRRPRITPTPNIPLGPGTDEELDAIPLGTPVTGDTTPVAGIVAIVSGILVGGVALMVRKTRKE